VNDLELTPRIVCLEDEDNLRIWRSSSVDAQYQLSKVGLNPDGHHEWFLARIAKVDVLPFLAFDADGETVAYVRLEEHGFGKAISVLVSPKHRSRSFGTLACQMFLKEYASFMLKQDIFAVVHRNNQASLSLFKKLGFVVSRLDESEFVEMRLEV
jgi:ribosomal protein S18 acetylase RimI-like enzyme